MTATSLCWVPNIGSLSTVYRTYALDSIGDVGRSISAKAIAHSSELVQWLDEVFTALDLGDKINLMGVSHGGWLTTQYALRFPSRLGKIVLLAPGATVLRNRAVFYLRGAMILTGRRYFTRATIYWLLEDLAYKNASAVEAAVDRVHLTFQCIQPRRLVAPTVLTDHELRSLRMPTLFLVGEYEKVYSAVKAVQRLNIVAPHIITEIIPNAGHDLTIAQPDIVNVKILEFLAKDL